MFFAFEPPDAAKAIGMVVFFLCALGAELKPVSLDIAGKRVVSLAFVFIVSAQILFGWEAGVVVGAAAMLISQVTDWRGPLKVVFNCSVYAIAALASAGLHVGNLVGEVRGRHHALRDAHRRGVHPGRDLHRLQRRAGLRRDGDVGAQAVRAGDRGSLPPFGTRLRDHGLHGGARRLAVVVNPLLLVLLAGPLLTLDLYQRYALSTRVARDAAETDSLTGLGNHRAYQHAIRVAVEQASDASPVALCLIDLDNFKQINDAHGHAIGDRALADVAVRLGAVDKARGFRLGGDEFALIVDGPADRAADLIERIQQDLPGKRARTAWR